MGAGAQGRARSLGLRSVSVKEGASQMGAAAWAGETAGEESAAGSPVASRTRAHGA